VAAAVFGAGRTERAAEAAALTCFGMRRKRRKARINQACRWLRFLLENRGNPMAPGTTTFPSDQFPPGGSASFRTTHWSTVLAAGRKDSAIAAAALEKLCRAYWYPLYAFVRRRGSSKHDAEDLTQGFFAQLLRREAFGSVAPGQGRFRSFLLTSLKNYLGDEHDRARAQKRGGGQPTVSFDAGEAEQRYRLEPVTTETPETLFERRWAITLTESALTRLEQEYAEAGKTAQFEQLHVFLVEGASATPYAEMATRLGMTEEAVKKAVQRLRRRYQDAIRAEIAETVATASEVEEELSYLWTALRGGGKAGGRT
jgi:RNA polymerase sigma-70 factor (ECF subfamily)